MDNTCPVSAIFGSTAYNLRVRQVEERAGAIGVPIYVAIVAAPILAELGAEVAISSVARWGFSATARAATASRGAAVAERALAQGALRRTWANAAQTIKNVLRNSGRPHDFAGAAREARGIQTGFDHLTEMRQSIAALNRAVGSLRTSLQNPNLAQAERDTLSQLVRAGSNSLRDMQRAVAGR